VIELFDAARLTIKRDHTLALASGTLLFTAGAMAAYTGFVHLQLRSALSNTQQLQTQLSALAAPGGLSKNGAPSPRAALVADLRRQAEQLERQASLNSAYGAQGAGEPLLSPAQWMHSLGALAQADTSLNKVDIDRAGSVRVEGLATDTQALNSLVQAWEKQESLAPVQPRSLDIRQEKSPAPFLRFQLRASPSAPSTGSTATPAMSASSAAAAP
jgi:hypothetical protein